MESKFSVPQPLKIDYSIAENKLSKLFGEKITIKVNVYPEQSVGGKLFAPSCPVEVGLPTDRTLTPDQFKAIQTILCDLYEMYGIRQENIAIVDGKRVFYLDSDESVKYLFPSGRLMSPFDEGQQPHFLRRKRGDTSRESVDSGFCPDLNAEWYRRLIESGDSQEYLTPEDNHEREN